MLRDEVAASDTQAITRMCISQTGLVGELPGGQALLGAGGGLCW